MSTTTPVYGLTTPDPSTKLRDLGAETKAMVERIEEVLKTFDYNGEDPGAFGARVVALEAWKIAVDARLAKLPKDVQVGTTLVTIGAVNTPISNPVTFPRPFDNVPVVTATPSASAAKTSVSAVTKTGFTLSTERTTSTNTVVQWIAVEV